MVDLEPVVARTEEEVARELPAEVSAFSEVAEVVLRKRAHEGIFVVLQSRVRIVIRKIHTSVAVDHIDDHGDAVLVCDIDELLEIRTLPEAFVDAEISDREIAPVDRNSHIRERHDLYRIHTEIAEIGHDVAGAVEIAPEFGNVDLIDDEVR